MAIQQQDYYNKVYFIGAGPGDPDLITVKGRKIVEEADVVVYAGSLVNPKIIECRKEDSQLYNSAGMDLDEIIEVMKKGIQEGKIVARVHTGDPSIYGAIREQMDKLKELEIDFEVVPGVSSFVASAAALKKEFTLPNVSQTVICTRLEGRTPVPKEESLDSLASHRASMAIFLSVHMIGDVVNKLKKHYREDTPIAVVQRATWEDEKIVTGTLMDIEEKVKEANITKTAQILVGDFLGNEYSLSKLYDKSFSHGYRSGKE
ncbi:precorrin-4 C(11)-methyltransferase [Sporosalibacterium faouarense]|uniref:precorrin-4 C(11)-methyltransferase n=1 Tax=Sporosalibacterium faouarense TaxID=516123 RepID=UPI00192B5947|nr:precorrin-4 C(11)-methyltransferase [Sporosalibacterium faouarense]